MCIVLNVSDLALPGPSAGLRLAVSLDNDSRRWRVPASQVQEKPFHLRCFKDWKEGCVKQVLLCTTAIGSHTIVGNEKPQEKYRCRSISDTSPSIIRGFAPCALDRDL